MPSRASVGAPAVASDPPQTRHVSRVWCCFVPHAGQSTHSSAASSLDSQFSGKGVRPSSGCRDTNGGGGASRGETLAAWPFSGRAVPSESNVNKAIPCASAMLIAPGVNPLDEDQAGTIIGLRREHRENRSLTEPTIRNAHKCDRPFRTQFHALSAPLRDFDGRLTGVEHPQVCSLVRLIEGERRNRLVAHHLTFPEHVPDCYRRNREISRESTAESSAPSRRAAS